MEWQNWSFWQTVFAGPQAHGAGDGCSALQEIAGGLGLATCRPLALSLAGGALAVDPPGDTLTANTAVTLYEEEISDVSLSTFYVFDHENAGPSLQLAQRTRSRRPRQGSGGSAEDCAGGGPTCCASCATGGGCLI
jgi:hypothetical protein